MVFTPTLQMNKLRLSEVSGPGLHGKSWQSQDSLAACTFPVSRIGCACDTTWPWPEWESRATGSSAGVWRISGSLPRAGRAAWVSLQRRCQGGRLSHLTGWACLRCDRLLSTAQQVRPGRCPRPPHFFLEMAMLRGHICACRDLAVPVFLQPGAAWSGGLPLSECQRPT